MVHVCRAREFGIEGRMLGRGESEKWVDLEGLAETLRGVFDGRFFCCGGFDCGLLRFCWFV